MEPIIEIKNLCKSYSGVPALNNLTLSVFPGEIFGLLGANGAGKSTTMECMAGTKKPDSGSIQILGQNPRKGRKELFEKVGVQFQESGCQPKIKVKELCEMTAALYRRPRNYEPLLQQFGLEEKKNAFVGELSGGQRQRLFTVLALIPDASLVFLDELTTGLDVKIRREVWQVLLNLKKKGLTIFLTSHYMEEVQALCGRIAILKQGSLLFTGTVEEAIAQSPYDTLEDAYLWYTQEEEQKKSC